MPCRAPTRAGRAAPGRRRGPRRAGRAPRAGRRRAAGASMRGHERDERDLAGLERGPDALGVEALVDHGGGVVDADADQDGQAADVVERQRAEPAVARLRAERVGARARRWPRGWRRSARRLGLAGGARGADHRVHRVGVHAARGARPRPPAPVGGAEHHAGPGRPSARRGSSGASAAPSARQRVQQLAEGEPRRQRRGHAVAGAHAERAQPARAAAGRRVAARRR